ncbi:OB-fold protein [Escherichia albertii]|uniref:OB-fold protein n=1 Tax=Escherichia albertii TaxID=208962 RepID=UPI001F546C40|nr:hypothetical protein [Escherichia albertii]
MIWQPEFTDKTLSRKPGAVHKVEITGTVQEIAKNFTNDVIVRLESGNRLLPVMLSMEDSEKPKASKLKKGQKIVVTCEKMQLFIGAPSGSNCTFVQ